VPMTPCDVACLFSIAEGLVHKVPVVGVKNTGAFARISAVLNWCTDYSQRTSI
jgi:hypothetical protein